MSFDALVAGGGLAGSAAAILLARAGRRVVLIEREAGPHDKVCGEFLSHEALHYLKALGVDPANLGAVPLNGVRLVHGSKPVTAHLPFEASSLSRRVLDESMLQHAVSLGVDVRRGARVKSLVHDDMGWKAILEQDETLSAQAAFLATGKHDLKDRKRPPGPQSDLIGFKNYWTLTPGQAAGLQGHVELALFPGGYAGLQPVEGGRANLCLLVSRGYFGTLENSWDSLLSRIKETSPHVATRLLGAKPASSKPLAIASIPYGFVLDGFTNSDGEPFRLGDQAAVIPSFSGDGMSIALHSAHLAVRAHLSGEPASSYHAQLARDVRHQISRATRLSKTLVSPFGQKAAMGIARFAPPVLTGIASLTRISQRSLSRAASV